MTNYCVVYAQEKGKDTAYIGLKDEIIPGSTAFQINPFLQVDKRTLQPSGFGLSPPYVMPDTHDHFEIRRIGYRLTQRYLDLELAALKALKEAHAISAVQKERLTSHTLRDGLVKKKILGTHQVNLALTEAKNAGYFQETKILGRVVGTLKISPDYESLAEKVYRLETE